MTFMCQVFYYEHSRVGSIASRDNIGGTWKRIIVYVCNVSGHSRRGAIMLGTIVTSVTIVCFFQDY